jgi:predicted metal-dependent phosphoesterase TrpH
VSPRLRSDQAPRLIDLHLHTTASDGRCTPEELVYHAAAAGVTVMAVTDHDTMAAVPQVRAAAAALGIDVVPGIEITAVEAERDVHMLGYFLDAGDASLDAFLARQRADRIARVETMAAQLARLGMPVDLDGVIASARAQAGQSIGRPQVARAMIAAGHVATMDEAFGRWLGQGGPAYVSRTGATPAAVVQIIHAAGGLASIAHPGRTRIDAQIPALRDAGLDALEAFHSDHDRATASRYAAMARDLGLLMTGGSDYHGDPARGVAPGGASLPPEEWARVLAVRRRADG